MDDDVTRAIANLQGQLPEPRRNLSEADKDALVAKIGPLTTRNILNAKEKFPASRIPFLFSALDTQCVVDILANTMDAAVQRALVKKKK